MSKRLREQRNIRNQLARMDDAARHRRHGGGAVLMSPNDTGYGPSTHVTVVSNGEAIDDPDHNRRKLLAARQRLESRGVKFTNPRETEK